MHNYNLIPLQLEEYIKCISLEQYYADYVQQGGCWLFNLALTDD